MTRVAINGFGRIGRTLLRQYLKKNSNLQIAAINDLAPAETLAHLLQYDSVHGRLDQPVRVDKGDLVVGQHRIKLSSESKLESLPWRDLNIDVVAESTGLFTDKEQAAKHIAAGAKKVVVSAPGKGVDLTVCIGINSDKYDAKKHNVISNASCTTNCLAPLVKVLHDEFGVESGLMTTIHSYTNDQKTLDLPHKDLYRARAAAINMIPTSTGAAKAIGLVIPELEGKLHGISVRVPTPNVSLVDFVAQIKKTASVEAIHAAMKKAAETHLKGILAYNDKPLVSSDFNGDTHSCTYDAPQTSVMGKNLVKVLGWYDNETGYSARLLELLELVGR